MIEFGPLKKIDDSKISHMKILHTATDSTVLIVFLVEPCFFFQALEYRLDSASTLVGDKSFLVKI